MKWYVRVLCFFAGLAIIAAVVALIFLQTSYSMNLVEAAMYGNNKWLSWLIFVVLTILFPSFIFAIGVLLLSAAFVSGGDSESTESTDSDAGSLISPANPASPLNPSNPANPVHPIHFTLR